MSRAKAAGGGGKKQRRRKARKGQDAEAAVRPPVPEPAALPPEVADAAAPRPSERPRPAGQRLYDMPYSAVAPRLVNPPLGLHNLVARAGHNAAYTIDVTLLDAPDHRLIRSGVLLAHRVIDGRGEWYLTAPDWQPLLPKDRIELMGHSDLPEQLADLIRPLRRRAPLGPVAALSCDRREFALRDGDGVTCALLRDDKVTVRRGGLATARYRELMITPVGPGLDEDQAAWLDRALTGVGSTQVARFPRLVSRLGAPATGPTDIPPVTEPEPAGPFRRLVGQRVADRLRRVVEADLAVRGGDRAAATALVAEAAALVRELDALSPSLEADWQAELTHELGWLVGPPGEPTERVAGRLRSERYLGLLDLLVAAARAPRLAENRARTAAAEVATLLGDAVDQLGATAATAGLDDPAEVWAGVARRLDRLEVAADLAALVAPEAAQPVRRRLPKLRRRLDGVCLEPLDEQGALAAAAGLDAPAAFAAGRAWEQRVSTSRRARASFLDAWAHAARKLAGPGDAG